MVSRGFIAWMTLSVEGLRSVIVPQKLMQNSTSDEPVVVGHEQWNSGYISLQGRAASIYVIYQGFSVT